MGAADGLAFAPACCVCTVLLGCLTAIPAATQALAPLLRVQIIPAENLVAAYQANPGATLLAAAPDCAAGRVMLEALEAGTDGVLLQTDSPAEVRGKRLVCGMFRWAVERWQASSLLVASLSAAAECLLPPLLPPFLSCGL